MESLRHPPPWRCLVAAYFLISIGPSSAVARVGEGGVTVAPHQGHGDGAPLTLPSLTRRVESKIAALQPASKVRASVVEAMGELRQGDVVLLNKAEEADAKATAAAARTPPDLDAAARE